MNYTLENLKKIREMTGIGIKDCIKALSLNENDLNKSISWLKSESLISSKSSNLEDGDKINNFGIVKIKKIDNFVLAFALKCESDFVALNDTFLELSENLFTILFDKIDFLSNSNKLKEDIDFLTKDLINEASYSLKEKIYIENFNMYSLKENQNFGSYVHYNKKIGSFVIIENCSDELPREISIQVVANKPIYLEKESIPNDLMLNKIKEISEKEYESNKNKDQKIIKKIIEKKIQNWISEICLLEQKDFRNQNLKIADIISSNKAQINYFSLIVV